jgi:hypothetical protein
MMKRLLQPALCLIFCPMIMAQQGETSATGSKAKLPKPDQANAAAKPSRTVRIPMDTLVTVRLEQRISSGDSHVGDRIRFSLVDDLVVDGYVVVPAGTSCYANITHVWRSRPKEPSRGGELAFSDPKLELGHGKTIHLIEYSYDERHLDEETYSLKHPKMFLAFIAEPFWAPYMLLENKIRKTKGEREWNKNPEYKEEKRKLEEVARKNWVPHDTVYPVGRLFDYYVQREIDIRMDRLAISNPLINLQ